MTFKDNFISVVKCKGNVLREEGGYVTLPFGSEYSIYLKNLDSRTAVVDISIDGDDILDKSRLIVYPNNSIELEGHMKGSEVKNKFKFIKKTEEIVEHRGDKVDDGIIRVEITFEKRKAENFITYTYHNYYNWNIPYYYHTYPYVYDIPCDYTATTTTYNSADTTCNSADVTYTTAGAIFTSGNTGIKEDEGITVKGSESNQKFVLGSTYELEEQSRVIILKLRGKVGAAIAEKPITVKDRKVCETCGNSSKYSSKYCSRCGTYL